jgi:hypothetical protein
MSTGMNETSFSRLPVPISMPDCATTGGLPKAGCALGAAPAWESQHHAQDSAAASMAQVAASASKQSGLVRGNRDGNNAAAAPLVKRRQSPMPLNGDSEAKERRERDRIHAENTRLSKKAHLQQLEQEVATYREQLAASRDHQVTAQHGAQNRQQGVVPALDALQHSSAMNKQQNQTQAATKCDSAQQAARCLDTQWAVLDCFFQWLCSSESCSEQQWGTFAEQSCTLWLPVGSVQNTTTTSEAPQQCRALVRFTGAADILSYGRQHFLQVAKRAHTVAAAATAGVGATATAAKSMPDVRLQVVVERREMYTRRIDSLNRSTDSNTSCMGAPFFCRSAVTQGGGVVGVAMCKFLTDSTSSVQRLSNVNLIYDTCAMSTLLAAATTR